MNISFIGDKTELYRRVSPVTTLLMPERQSDKLYDPRYIGRLCDFRCHGASDQLIPF